MSRTVGRVLVASALAAIIAAFFALDLGRFASLGGLQEQKAAIETYRQAHPWLTAAMFFGAYVLVAAASLPGAVLMTLAAGAIFGLATGTLLVSFASSIGATLAFTAARFLWRDSVERR